MIDKSDITYRDLYNKVVFELSRLCDDRDILIKEMENLRKVNADYKIEVEDLLEEIKTLYAEGVYRVEVF